MLNARIAIDTTQSPYKVNRTRPTFLDTCFSGQNDWFIFCERIDGMLIVFEEIKAAWMVLGVVFTILLLCFLVGIIILFLLVDDNELLGILAGSLFAALLIVLVGYYCLMDRWVLRPLANFADKVDKYCAEISEKNDKKVTFQFERSRNWKLFWDADFKVWIDVSTSDAVDLRTE